jgi:two-component system chemotaxis response regulator CheY
MLVVDDAAPIRRMVARSIGMAGLPVGAVHEAANGREALEVLGRTWIDIVFSDVNMPEMDGLQLVSRMSTDPLLAGVPVVIVSTERSEERIAALRRLGIRAYLPKPFRPEDIRKVVLDVLGGGPAA